MARASVPAWSRRCAPACVLHDDPAMSTPTPHRERLELVDALRGAALFGVLLVNMLWFAGFENTLNEAQVAALTASRAEQLAETAIDLLVYAKSIGTINRVGLTSE